MAKVWLVSAGMLGGGGMAAITGSGHQAGMPSVGGLLDHFDAGGGEGEAQVGLERGVHIRAEGQQEQIGIDEFQRGVGGGEGVAEIGGAGGRRGAGGCG